MKKAAPHNRQSGAAHAHFTTIALVAARLPWNLLPPFALLALIVAGGVE